MTDPLGTLSVAVGPGLVLPNGTILEIGASLKYSTEDPFAISIVFHTLGGDVSWVFARELISEGLERPAGQGDVKIWPDEPRDEAGIPCCDEPRRILMCLGGVEGDALLEFDATDLSSFLHETVKMVPWGMESAQIDLDIEIDALLAS